MNCSACDGHGFQSGAHTERVVPCPRCGGTGKQRPAARGSESREAERAYETWLESLKDHGP